ncbi:Bug family tripartite tricarboxylate transporter substrate binding protein [Roseococcus sp. YIM B11640]|uniref:Bug family tripartite tricarboxylate transporter substrate binding protein n=1 Tax=Roseococcus sp. YIM B11640 TaxID=3133973 RepID=UPI003C79FD98
MSLTRRAALAASLLAPPALAQEAWPARPIRMVLPYAPGGATDVICRLIADRLSTRLPQRVVVENRTGAGGNIGAGAVARSAPDGYTLLFTNNGHAVNKLLYAQLDYDPEKDLVPVSIVAESPMLLIVPSGRPWRSLADFVAAVRAAPNRYSYGTTGGGGTLQLVSLLLLQAAGLQMTDVPYRGAGPAYLDLVAGTLDMLYDASAGALPLVREGKVRALAVSTPQRAAALPDVPSVTEAYPDAAFSVWQTILAPAGTPAPILARLHAELRAVMAEEGLRSRLAELGVERLVGNSPAEAASYIAAETRRWPAIFRAAGIQAQ